jgi:ribokinase
MKYDFVALGDIVVDTFIDLSKDDARVVCDIEGRPCQLMMNFGEKLPYNDAVVLPAVGNSPNAAVSAHRLGLKAALYTNVGKDKAGDECLDTLRTEGIATEFVFRNEGKMTNQHYVLRYGAERTILIKHEEYRYQLPVFTEPPRYLYFSSIGENSLPFHHEVATYVKTHPETKLVFQPGTFQIKLGSKTLRDIYEVTEIFFCNKEEAQYILDTKNDDITFLLRGIKELGPKIPVITDGPKGAYALDIDDVSWYMPIYPDPAPPVDRTGAGDSFASTFTAAIALGLPVSTALAWGPINSMSVVQFIGAQKGLLTRQHLEEYLSHAPSDYVAKRLTS